MAEKDAERKKPLPPYIPFKTFKGFIRKLKDSTVPDQIDLSILRSYSGSLARQIMAALKYLRLIDSLGKTSDQLRDLVTALDDPAAWHDSLSDLIFNTYRPILGDLNIDTATSKQFSEKFRAIGAEGQMLQKCEAFFTSALADAGITISPHITNKPRKPRSDKSKGRSKKSANDDEAEELGNGGSSLLPVNTARFVFPIPEKGTATILIPSSLASEDWEMINTMMEAYIRRLASKKE